MSRFFSRIFRIIPPVILIIILLSAFMRLWRISEYMTFLGDEGRDVLIVKRMIVDHRFTLLGPTASVGGFFLGPIYYYFMIPFLWLWNFDPTGPAVMVALFGIATVYLVYLTAKEMFSEKAGLTAAAVYALSPVVIAYSRSSWNPNIVPFFAMLLIYVLWRLTGSGKMKSVMAAGIILGIGIQLHYLFSFLFLVTGLWLLLLILYKKMSWWKTVLSLIFGFIIGNFLFLLFEVRHGFPNTRSIINFVLEGKDTGFSIVNFFFNIVTVSYRLFGRLVLNLPEYNILEKIPPILANLWVTSVYALLVYGIGYCIFSIVHNKVDIYSGLKLPFENKPSTSQSEKLGLLLILVWYIVVILLFGFYKRSIYDYYFGIVFPLPFIVTGFMIDKLSRKFPAKIAAILLFGCLVILNWQGRPFRYQPNNQLAQARNIARAALEKTGNKPFNFALLAGQNTDHSYRYFFEIWGNAPVVIENTSVDPERKSVTDQLIVICEEARCKPLGHPLWEIAGFGRAEIVEEWDVSFVKIYKLIHYQGA